jgi:hypothetical protein
MSPTIPTPNARARAREGRPSKYQLEHCEIVVALGYHGASIAQMARAIGVSRSRLYAWERQYPDFRDAIARARVAALAWWEEIGRQGIIDPDFNAPAYVFEMCRRFPGDYSRDGWSRGAKAENPSAGTGKRNTEITPKIERAIVPGPASTHAPTYKRDRETRR